MGVKTKSNYSPSGRDLFQTPRYATELLLPFLPRNMGFDLKKNEWVTRTNVWECASGNGAITRVLQENGFRVWESDLRSSTEEDFLTNAVMPFSPYIIVTNPPFSRKKQFYERCLELKVPFALLVPADYSMWMIDAVRNKGCVKIIPTRRIDYITPSGKDASVGATADFHSLWLTRWIVDDEDFYPATEKFVDLSLEDKKRIY